MRTATLLLLTAQLCAGFFGAGAGRPSWARAALRPASGGATAASGAAPPSVARASVAEPEADASEPEPASAPAPEGETYEFEAEVSRVMDIIINSLYSDRDVFLRELISNAADACDKKRFLSLTDGAEGAEGEEGPQLGIRVQADPDLKTLTIMDSGVGMTREELKTNLGRIAQSGTAKFVEQLKESKAKGQDDLSLIGQFGVGFYSGYLVADQVTVTTKSAKGDGETLTWTSSGESYTISDGDSGEPIEGSSGTRIVLKLKPDCDEYSDNFKLKNMLLKYSEFVSFPIELWGEKTTYESVPDPDAPAPAEGEAPATKSVPLTVKEWERMNKQAPVWTRDPKSVSQEEYDSFYQSTFKAYDKPVAQSHFNLEGQVEFKALLYVPESLPYELSRNMFDENSNAVRLYVKRVFINDKFEDLIPRWLMFLRGVVDSEDLPLNVGREILQKSKMLTIINKRLVRKSLDMFKKIERDDPVAYLKFWENFGKYLKVGIIESPEHKDALAKLCRFYSTSSGANYTTLDSYVENMKSNQSQIFYVTGDGKKAAQMSPVLEKLNKLEVEVLYMTEPLDELTVQSIGAFAGKDLVDAAKEDLSYLDEDLDEAGKEAKEAKAKELLPFTDWLKTTLGARVTKVELSSRLTESPAALVQSAYSMSPTMQRYMKAQAVAVGEDEAMFGAAAATLEVNAEHPVVMDLANRYATEPSACAQSAQLLYDVAALTGGYSIEDPAAFAKRVTSIMGAGVAAAPAPAPAPPKAEPEAKADEAEADEAEADDDSAALDVEVM